MSNAFSESERNAVYRAIATRRDVRRGYTAQPLPDELLERLLSAAHSAPSVGLMQPSRFIVVRDPAVREVVHGIFSKANTAAAATYSGEQRQHYSDLKLEGIREAPQNLCVVCDANSERGHKLGRQTMPETSLYSTVCAIQNLWLAARAEGVGVGWVSIIDPERLQELLGIPQHLVIVAYLCIGYVDHFAAEPDLERHGWETRTQLRSVISYDRYSDACSGADCS
ncbi:5,6-dimethylbenzimidazole synthase [Silvibacterium bohemicum]|uniref:5,6-dimethylbenzimidazole synthase n=1 Tax=Silvibacterium bohemicum TaxID=1577686 RepID=A0A841JNI9_9BACT|nr:5,6-dimethylbenzimidazole synthase [Silvibacterium bohemicum]MBB6142926.1 5,6-dimethylbenzimidazole synthase [Silvibacterium bohemicum]